MMLKVNQMTQTIVAPKVFDIAQELESLDKEAASRLALQNKNLSSVSASTISKEQLKLDSFEAQASPLTKQIIEHMFGLHAEFNDMLAQKLTDGKINETSYGHFLIQAWYHTRYTPEFEALFGRKLSEYIQSHKDKAKFEKGNKFILHVEAGVDEEAGHELWAIQDLKGLGWTEFDTVTDVFPQTKALIATQFDRLNRLNFKGFLGYSFYLEFWVAKYSQFQLDILESVGISRKHQSFIYNHYVVDQGHALDNVELLNFLIETQADVDEVLDNMNIIHALYYQLVANSFV
jgi:hypothetical protein